MVKSKKMKRKITKEMRRLINWQNQEKGKGLERFIVNCCRAEKLCHFKIADGGKPAPKTPAGFVRFSQVCDFIIIIKGKAYLLDAKNKKTKTLSAFFPPQGKVPQNSQQRQTANFIQAYRHGFKRCGFLYKFDWQETSLSFLPVETIYKAKYEGGGNKGLVFKGVERLSDISYFVGNA